MNAEVGELPDRVNGMDRGSAENPDVQEALSIKYVVGLRVARLSSGAWAIYQSSRLVEITTELTSAVLERLYKMAETERTEREEVWRELEEEKVRGTATAMTAEEMGL